MDLCVTADDYGLAPAVNAGIERLANRGCLTAVSIMVHPAASLDRVATLAETGVATGLHLVLVEERGLASRQLPPQDYRQLFAHLLRRPWTQRALRREIEAQFDRYDRLGLPLHFVNSHQHTHEFPLVWPALAEVLAHRPGVALRSTAGGRPRLSRQGAVTVSATLSHWLRPSTATRLRPIGIDFAGHPTIDAIERALVEPSVDSALRELIMHPGDEDTALRYRYEHWGYHWANEQALLGSDAFGRMLARRGVSLRSPRGI